MKTLAQTILIAAAMLFLVPVQILACACCAERGHYSREESVFDKDWQDRIANIRITGAILYSDAGYPETIVGIDPIGDTFSINNALAGKSWTLNFTDDQDRAGMLALVRPDIVEEYMADREPLKETTMPVLYKELRFKSNVGSGTGFFKHNDKKVSYELILQGEGNVCFDEQNYKTYILQVKGKTTSYSFYGKLMAEEGKMVQSHIDKAGRVIAN